MKKNIGNHVPSLVLLTILVGFPQISETIFSPTLPAVASAFVVSMSDVQLVMSIYFVAFALGVFFFGHLSDWIGRRKAMLCGLFFYFIGSVLCLLAKEMNVLLVARFVQAFGASVGSVITQTILRESFSGVQRHQRFAQISAALAFTPAIGPLIGGFTDYYVGFKWVFVLLIFMSIFVFCYAFFRLPETVQLPLTIQPIRPIIMRMWRNSRLWYYGVLIGGINGLLFSYYTEAPFIFTQLFELTSMSYGLLGILVACATIAGAYLSKYLVSKVVPEKIILLGIAITLLGAVLSASVVLLPTTIQMSAMLISIFVLLFGMGTALPNCLSLALVDFQDVLGSASALFSLGYYLVVSLVIYGMSIWHNGTLLAMPLYFIFISLVLFIVSLQVWRKI